MKGNFILAEPDEIDRIILILKKLANFILKFYLGCSWFYEILKICPLKA